MSVLVDEAAPGLPKELAFTAEEYEHRLERVRALMYERDLQVLLVHHPPNVHYLTGYQCASTYVGECAVVPREGEVLLLVPATELGSATLQSMVRNKTGFERSEHPSAALAALLKRRALVHGRAGVDLSTPAMPAASYAALQRALPHQDLFDASGLVERVKRIKSPTEIAHLRHAATITALGMRAALDAVTEGATDNDIAAAAYQAAIAGGSEYMAWPPVVTTGRRSGIMHSTHKRNPIAYGDPVDIEIGACFQRYTAPLMRTATVGPPSDGVRRFADACLRILDLLMGLIRPGASGQEIADAAWRVIELREGEFFHGNFAYAVGAGFPPTWADGTGVIRKDVALTLEPNMVFHLPIALRAVGKFGVMISETVVITPDGCEELTDVARDLVIRS